MTLIEDLMRWYRCTREAAEHIVQCAAERAKQAGQPFPNDLYRLADLADMPFHIRQRRDAPTMTLEDVKSLQATVRAVRARRGGGDTA